MRNKANTEEFNAFFDGRQGPKLFIFYQVRFFFRVPLVGLLVDGPLVEKVSLGALVFHIPPWCVF